MAGHAGLIRINRYVRRGVGLQWDGIWGFVEVVVDGKSVIEVVSPAPASQCEVLTADCCTTPGRSSVRYNGRPYTLHPHRSTLGVRTLIEICSIVTKNYTF